MTEKANSSGLLTKYFLWLFIIWAIGYTPFVLASFGLFPETFIFPFMILGGGSPTIAAVLVLYGEKKHKLNPSLVFKGFTRQAAVGTNIGVGLGLVLVIHIGSTLVWILTTEEGVYDYSQIQWYLLFSFFLNNLLMNIWEEIGWRGFALPLFQEKYNALVSNVLLGVFWGLWHIPHFFYYGSQMPVIYGNFGLFMVITVVSNFIYGHLYNKANGNLWVVTLYHVFMNTIGTLLLAGRMVLQSPIYLLSIYGIIAVILIAVYGPVSLTKNAKVTWSMLVEDFQKSSRK